ncbi:IS3 family transposase [Johnsonella ignava]|nr:IS3 family transposase [Johnsonella ignava]
MNGSPLPISTQVRLLELNRSGLHYQPIPHSTEDLHIKQMIDKIYTRYSMYGYRRICWYMNKIEHYVINHKAVVLRHMKEMGIQAVYPRQNTSKSEPANKIIPTC